MSDIDYPVNTDDRTPFSDEDAETGSIRLPSGGISVSDEMEAAQADRFVTEVVPIKGLPGIAQLVTSATVRGSFEPVRYLVGLSPRNDTDYVMVDVPPYSPQLVTRMKAFLGVEGRLSAILMTSRDAIHYDEAPSVFSARRADLDLWAKAFPGIDVIAYRLDIPRDCRPVVTQVLDGYGPFALDEDALNKTGNVTFVETGRPLQYEAWEHDVAQSVLKGKLPPDDQQTDDDVSDAVHPDYTPEAIRAREEGRRLLAAYAPGHSFGSLSFVFPERNVCCTGFTLPVEDTRAEENEGLGMTGPALDCRGYITTSRAGMTRQMESARAFVNSYYDRFQVVLPSRGDPMYTAEDAADRKQELLEIVDQYDRIGQIYEQLGITGEE